MYIHSFLDLSNTKIWFEYKSTLRWISRQKVLVNWWRSKRKSKKWRCEMRWKEKDGRMEKHIQGIRTTTSSLFGLYMLLYMVWNVGSKFYLWWLARHSQETWICINFWSIDCEGLLHFVRCTYVQSFNNITWIISGVLADFGRSLHSTIFE